MQIVEGKQISGADTPDQFTELFLQYKSKPWFERVYPGTDPFTDSLVGYRTWYATIVDFDPIPHLTRTSSPVFWIFGDSELDQSGPVELSMSNLRRLQTAGKPYTILQCDDEGHNVSERKYERELYEWLYDVNHYREFEFQKH